MNFYAPENLHRVPLSGDGDDRLLPYASPRPVERGVLPEAGLVGKDDFGMSGRGFFLRLGYV